MNLVCNENSKGNLNKMTPYSLYVGIIQTHITLLFKLIYNYFFINFLQHYMYRKVCRIKFQIYYDFLDPKQVYL